MEKCARGHMLCGAGSAAHRFTNIAHPMDKRVAGYTSFLTFARGAACLQPGPRMCAVGFFYDAGRVWVLDEFEWNNVFTHAY